MSIPNHASQIIFLMASICLAGVCAGEEQISQTDETIQKAIAEHLGNDEVLRGRTLDIKVSDGIVRLDGPVASLYEHERAARIASTLKGVRSVVNTTTIDSERRPDGGLATDIAMALSRDPATDRFEIDVKAARGTVTLTGTVDSYAEKALAGQVAKDVRGVHRLNNDLEVRLDHDRSDKEIDAEITRRLEADVWVDQRLIRVFVDDGHVSLRGIAGTLAEKDAAKFAAWVAGVRSVDVSELQVDWQSLDTARKQNKFIVRADYQIKDALADALRYDPRVNRFAIDIDIDGTTVVLSGQVHNLAAKRAAEQDAFNTVGITRVDNRLQVIDSMPHDDAQLMEDLKAAFRRDSYLTDADLQIDVDAANATLSGTVDSAFVKQRADDVASRVRGLLDIDNQIKLSEQARIVSDLDIKYGIKNRMYWSGYMRSQDVRVQVDDGVATLAGKVDSRSAFDMATKMAIEAGAREVNNRLLIRDVVARP